MSVEVCVCVFVCGEYTVFMLSVCQLHFGSAYLLLNNLSEESHYLAGGI